uniref:WW domain-containing protein n=1 Tax=Globodera pallida TaxID=36090 RepID=A0A183CPC9_GLOPA
MAASLPPLLLQRLKKRGIVPAKNEDEEVFAENYDQDDGSKSEFSREKYRGGAPGCPNKHIPVHVCTEFCFDHWQEGYPENRLSEKYLEQRKKMLRNYPLPKDWVEIYDAGVRRHYYWNQMTDEVCWLSPKHPKAVISEAAAKVARNTWNTSKIEHDESDRNGRKGGRERDEREGSERKGRERYRGKRTKDYELALPDSDDEGGRQPVVELTDRDRLKRAKRRGVDPMDPSAYGDAPTGGWTSGLREDQEVKTGVDVTASGPLFQQRPYPAPGAILRKQNPDLYKDK